MTDLITAPLVRLDVDLGSEKQEVVRGLAQVVAEAGRSADPERLVADVLAREEVSATGLPGGIAIPHSRTSGVTQPTIAFARLATAVPFGAKDGPADLVFLLATPPDAADVYLPMLTKLTRAIVIPAFIERLRSIGSPQAVVAEVAPVVGR